MWQGVPFTLDYHGFILTLFQRRLGHFFFLNHGFIYKI